VCIGTGTKTCLYWDSHKNMSILGQPQKYDGECCVCVDLT
jgi:hypothetical protein